MSRVGKQAITVPSGVTVEFQPPVFTVKGGQTTLRREIHPQVEVKIENGVITVRPKNQGREARALWGLTRTLIHNMVVGVNKGFTRVLEVVGVGYRAEVKGDHLHFSLGYSHPIDFPLPPGIAASLDKQNRIVLSGADKELLGLTAARLRALRRPEPYKGKGVKYVEEIIQRKVGKAGAK
ncbi:MAG: 50S ribosomal protein L6 [Thermodesulfobacteriota bacterium]